MDKTFLGIRKKLIAADDKEPRYVGVIHHENIYASKILMMAMDRYHSNSE